MSRLVRTLLAAVLLAGLSAVPAFAAQTDPGTEGDPGGGSLFINDVTDAYDQPTFLFETDSGGCLSEGTLAVPGATGLSVQFDDPNSGTLFLTPDTPAGSYDVEYTCTTDNGPVTFTGFIDFGYVQVDKVVEGTAPADAQFTIDLTCGFGDRSAEDAYGGAEGSPGLIDTTLTFGPTGGSQLVVHYGGQFCTITETGTGGATTVTVETTDCESDGPLGPRDAEATSGTFDIGAPTTCVQTVTNVFPDDVGNDDVVRGAPTFTG